MSLQYYNSAFKVALVNQWVVIVNGPKMIEDIRKRPDDEVSFMRAFDEVCD